MKIYGVAILAACYLVGQFIGDWFGRVFEMSGNLGGVGFAMILLILLNDYLNKKIYLSNENRFTQKDNLNIVNISFKIINETIIVKSIVKNSAFDKIGIKLGDVIQSVNDKKGRTFKNSCELNEFLSYHHENNMNLTIEILNKKNELITKTFTTNDIYEYPKRIK
jgi:C-terminal processing protease CtpA/Prc